MFATIRSVNASTRRCTVEVDDSTGRRLVHDVLITEPMPGSNCTPKNGQDVEVSSSNSGWFIERYLNPETDRANQERDHLNVGPGDNVFGGVGNGTVGVLDGGIVVAQADMEEPKRSLVRGLEQEFKNLYFDSPYAADRLLDVF